MLKKEENRKEKILLTTTNDGFMEIAIHDEDRGKIKILEELLNVR